MANEGGLLRNRLPVLSTLLYAPVCVLVLVVVIPASTAAVALAKPIGLVAWQILLREDVCVAEQRVRCLPRLQLEGRG